MYEDEIILSKKEEEEEKKEKEKKKEKKGKEGHDSVEIIDEVKENYERERNLKRFSILKNNILSKSYNEIQLYYTTSVPNYMIAKNQMSVLLVFHTPSPIPIFH